MIFRSALVLFAVFCCSPVWAASWADEMFTTRNHDFGTVARNAKAEFEFVFTNQFIQDVHIASAKPSCSCTIVSVKNPQVKTYEKGAIVAKFNTKAFRGQRSATITVTFDKPSRTTVQLQVKGYIRSDVSLDPSGVDLGEVEPGTAVEKTIRVTRNGRSDWRIREVTSSSPYLSGEVARVVRDGSRVTCDVKVRLEPGAPVGYIRDHFMLVTNDDRGKQIPVQVDGRIRPPVMVSPSSLFLGVFKPGQTETRQLVVRGRAPFRVLSVGSQHDAVEAKLSADGAARPIHIIPVTFTAREAPGRVVEVIRIQTDLEGEATEITALAVVRT